MKIRLSAALISCSVFLTAQVPFTKKTEQTDVYFGVKVNDPYHWLEDDRSKETEEWVKTQNKYTESKLVEIPYREKVKKRLTELWNFEKQSAPYTKAGKLFFYKNNGIQNQSVLYVQDNEKTAPRVLLDPNKLSEDGTISITTDAVSKNGKYYAFSYSRAGSDWNTIQIMDINSLNIIDEEITWIKFSGIEWNGEDGFYYSKYEQPEAGKELVASNENQRIMYHKIGTNPKQDQLIFSDEKHPKRSFYCSISDDNKYLIISGTESTSGNSLHLKKIGSSDESLISIADDFEHDYNVLDLREDKLIILTNYNAPNRKVIELNVNQPDLKQAKDIIPQRDDLLENVTIAKDCFILNYLRHVTSKMEIRDLQGKLINEIKLPDIGKVNAINFEKEQTVGYIDFVTFTQASSVYKMDIKTGMLNLQFQPKINFNSKDYETKQVFYKSKDGTKIPMFIVAKKGIKLDGTNPCFLFGYGGFNSYYAPEFRIDRCVFLEQGGVYAIPGIRGGGEYGENWHKAGTLANKQNVFDDFIAAAEYLFAEKYTNPTKLAIHGRSNGGLLIGAVMTQRPDLCKVAIPTVGVLDMLRYHKFTIGWAWATDYGTSENEPQFNYLFKYSPLHNVKKLKYPATLILTGDHDDRVVPAHSFKFAATLQEYNQSENPIMIRIDTNAGHGSGKPTSKQIAEYSDMWSFIFHQLGMNIEK